MDTDTLTLNQQGHPTVCRNVASHPPQDIATTVISIEEQLSGWYTLLRRVRQRDQLALAYPSLADMVHFLAPLPILSFSVPAIIRFEYLKAMKLGVAAQDLRIAAICLEYGTTLVTRNTRDFQRVPNLIFVDWSV